MRERETDRQTEKHEHASRLTTIAKSVVTIFGLTFFRLAPFLLWFWYFGSKICCPYISSSHVTKTVWNSCFFFVILGFDP